MSSGTKVFVGNLAYSTTEQDLYTAFEKCGKVIDAKVVRRGNRSKGYGFVDFEDENDAQKSVDALDKVELNGRSINVQLSTSSNDGETRTTTRRNYNDDRSFNDRPRYGNSGGFGGGFRRNNNNNNYGGGRYNNNFRRGGYNRNSPTGGRRVYSLRKNYDDRDDDRDDDDRRDNRRDDRRRNRSNVEKVESTTIVFVANLPYSYYDEDLVELFKQCGEIKTAHVVRTRGKSKGYGFVEFQTHEGQLAALEKMENYTVENNRGEERQLSVKVAMADKESEQESGEDNDNDANEGKDKDEKDEGTQGDDGSDDE